MHDALHEDAQRLEGSDEPHHLHELSRLLLDCGHSTLLLRHKKIGIGPLDLTEINLSRHIYRTRLILSLRSIQQSGFNLRGLRLDAIHTVAEHHMVPPIRV